MTKPDQAIQKAAWVCALTAALSLPAVQVQAQVNFSITIGPPALLYEPVPVMTPGYVWAPGYWAWHEDRHIWIRGRTIYQRSGYRWEPDGWEQQGARYIQRPGRWEPIYVQAPMNHGQAKKKHDRKDKRSKGDDNEQGNGKGRDKRESK